MHRRFRTSFATLCFWALLSVGAIATPDDPAKALTKGLVGHWKFDEHEGPTVLDSSDHATAGTLEGGATRIGGPLGRALSFDGRTGHALVGSPAVLDLPAEMSLLCWLRFDDLAASQYGQCVYGQTKANGVGGQYELCVARGKAMNEVTVLWKDVDICISNAKLKTGQWYHIGFTRTGKPGDWTCTIYVDGAVNSVVKNITTDVGPASPFAMGRPGAFNGLYFNGAIDDLRIYNRAVTAKEVGALFESR